MTQTCTTCGLVIVDEDKPIVAWAYYCDNKYSRSPFIRYVRADDDKFRNFPWIETPLFGSYPGLSDA